MSTELNQRRKWAIDRTLDGFIGEDVRVAAKAFSPVRRNDVEAPRRLIPVRDLFLADNSQPGGLPVFFEGRLHHFERQIGVVFLWLDAPTSPETATDGPVYFRGKTAVILRGPAVVELAFPFQVERLPAGPENYWRDLRLPCAQFEFPFAPEAGSGGAKPRSAPAPVHLQTAAPAPAAPVLVSEADSPERRLAPIDSRAQSAVDPSSREDAVKGGRCRPPRGRKPAPIRNLNYSPSTH
jgi:hypothetical protein